MHHARQVRFSFSMTGLIAGLFLMAFSLSAQTAQLPNSSSSGGAAAGAGTSQQAPSDAEVSSHNGQPGPAKPPAVIDPSGPATSLETSESVFDVMAALNTCGYNEGLATSDPVRQKVRDDIFQALSQSEPARQARDRMCAFIQTHTMNSAKLNLAAYLSLALYLTAPPELTPNVGAADLPPDAVPLVDLVPRLKAFAETINLHVIWVLNHDAYESELEKVRKSLSQMIVQVDLYLKQPPASYGNRRFLVILEPLIAPGEVNARVYGGDYIVVASPVNGQVNLKEIKHTYLHFELEPLIYARSESIDQLAPILALVQPAPLAFSYKSDILALVTECMIRAIEAHTMDPGVPVYHEPAHIDRSQLAAVNNAENAYEHKVSVVRQQAVDKDMVQGFILTQYFFDQLRRFPENSTSLQEIVGEMVYGMNVDIEKRRIQDIAFVAHTDQDVLQQGSPDSALLDRAERKLVEGDTAAAAQLAQRALSQHTGNPGRAQFILARADIMSGKMDEAEQAFQQATHISHNARTIAWSHIYLGRMDDLQDDRPAAIAEYQAAMKTRDGKPDTKQAAEAGLAAPFAPPQAARRHSGAGPSAAQDSPESSQQGSRPGSSAAPTANSSAPASVPPQQP